jgi:hypothetical protein
LQIIRPDWDYKGVNGNKTEMINSKKNSPYRKPYISSTGKEIPYILWKTNVRYLAENTTSLVQILSEINPVLVIASYLRSIIV